MIADNSVTFDTMSEADLEPVLELLQGGNPDVIARKAGITKAYLFRIQDDLLAHVERERAKATDAPPQKIGRNDPCPCGSGKKFKHCCLDRHTTVGQAPRTGKEAEQANLIKRTEKAFGLLRSGRYTEAIDRASTLITRYPNEDRLHDIIATGHLYAGNFKTAIDICRNRLVVAQSEKSYFIEHGRYRDSAVDQPVLAYYYPPLTWLQKYWIALKSSDYHALVPLERNAAIIDLVEALQAADDATRFTPREIRHRASTFDAPL